MMRTPIFEGQLQAKHIDDASMMLAIVDLGPGRRPAKGREFRTAKLWDFEGVLGCPARLALAKIRRLMARGLVDGCDCGCRGDFELTEDGEAWLRKREEDRR